MSVHDFDYELPPERIARFPARPRDAARLLVHERASGRSEDRVFRDLARLLRPGDLLVVNDTRVLPHRLLGRRATGGKVECLILERQGALCRGLLAPARRIRPGQRLSLEDGMLEAEVLERGDGGRFRFRLEARAGLDLEEALRRFGRAPLPPYLGRSSEVAEDERTRLGDLEAYQTLFARHEGAVAAPTAGLHFTQEVLAGLAAAGVEMASVTLHVGEGTFLPVRAERVEDHSVPPEPFAVSQEAADAVEHTRRRGARVVAVGTTVARALETVASAEGLVAPGWGSTALFLRPGYRFRVVDALLTNFHLPRSTLLMLVAALAGRERVLDLYRHALREGYRFYSFGDAMLLL